jgi:hypothetical protein
MFSLPSGPSLSPPINLSGPVPVDNTGAWLRNPGIMGAPLLTDNNQYGGTVTNGTASRAYNWKLPENEEEAKADVGKNEIIIVHSRNNAFVKEMLQRNQPRSWSRFNYWQKTESQRMGIGSQSSCEDLATQWSPTGVAVRDLPDFTGGKNVVGDSSMLIDVSTLRFAGRVCVRDLWLATGVKSKIGDVLYMILVKCEFHQGPNEKPFKLARGPARDGNQCWQLMPYVGVDGKPPSPFLYVTPHWQGRCYRIGFVSDRYGNQKDMVNQYGNIALAALSPKRDGDQYRKELNSLPEVEIMYQE